METDPTNDRVNRRLVRHRYWHFNALTQVRKNIDEDQLKPLASSIGKTHQMNPILAVRLSPDEAKEYLSWLNDLWRLEGEERHKLSNHTRLPHSEDVAYIIAGHRRWEVFNLGLIRDEKVEAFMYPGLSPFRAIKLQLHENTYKAPDTARKYMAIDRYLRLHQRQGRAISKAECARHLGINPEVVTKASRFANLPQTIRRAIGNKGIQLSPGHGVLLERLAEGWRKKLSSSLESEHEIEKQIRQRLINRANKILEKGLTVSEFKDQIAGRLNEVEKNQQSFFEPETANPQPKRVFDRQTVRWAGRYRRMVKSKFGWLKTLKENGETENQPITNDLEYQANESLSFAKFILENFEEFLRFLRFVNGTGLLPESEMEEVQEVARSVGKYGTENGTPQG